MNAKKIEEKRVKVNFLKSFVRFFGSLKQEFKKISWTSQKELKKLTKIVLISTFIVGLMIYGIDMGIQKSLAVLSFIIQRIFG